MGTRDITASQDRDVQAPSLESKYSALGWFEESRVKALARVFRVYGTTYTYTNYYLDKVTQYSFSLFLIAVYVEGVIYMSVLLPTEV